MATLVVYANTNDSDISTISATYTTALSGVSFSIPATSAGNLYVGQDASFHVYEAFLVFDTTPLLVGIIPTSATLSTHITSGISGTGPTNFTLRARAHGFAGSSLASSDWVDPRNASSYTLLAHLNTNNQAVTGAFYTWSDDAFAANVVNGGLTKVFLDSADSEAATQPTTNMHNIFDSADTAGTTNDPSLTIVYSDDYLVDTGHGIRTQRGR